MVPEKGPQNGCVCVCVQDTDKSERKHRKHKDRNSDRPRAPDDTKDRSKHRSKRDADQNRAAMNDLEEFLGCGDNATSSGGPYESL